MNSVQSAAVTEFGLESRLGTACLISMIRTLPGCPQQSLCPYPPHQCQFQMILTRAEASIFRRVKIVLIRWSKEWRVRFQSEQNSTRCFHDAGMDPNVLGYCVYIAECSLQWTACVQRARAGTEVEEVDSLDSA